MEVSGTLAQEKTTEDRLHDILGILWAKSTLQPSACEGDQLPSKVIEERLCGVFITGA
jgi:hypothetical protein